MSEALFRAGCPICVYTTELQVKIAWCYLELERHMAAAHKVNLVRLIEGTTEDRLRSEREHA